MVFGNNRKDRIVATENKRKRQRDKWIKKKPRTLIRNWAFILPEKETLENFGQKWHLI